MAENHATAGIDSVSIRDRQLARLLLRAQKNGLTIGFLYRTQVKAYIALLIMFGIGIGYFAWIGVQPGVYMINGALLGVLLRDFGVIRHQARSWKTHEMLLNWEKVKRLAAADDDFV